MEEYMESNNQTPQSDFSRLKKIESNHEVKQIDMNEQDIRNLFVSLLHCFNKFKFVLFIYYYSCSKLSLFKVP